MARQTSGDPIKGIPKGISCPPAEVEWLRIIGAGNARRGLRAMVAYGQTLDAEELREILLAFDPDALGPTVTRLYPGVTPMPGAKNKTV